MLRVLLVDDETDVRQMLRILLAGEGWEIAEAASGEEALARCREDPPDVIVLDNKMPETSGMDTARLLRKEGIPSEILLYTAYLSPTIDAAARSIGLTVLTKTDLLPLVQTLRSLEASRTPGEGPAESNPGS